MKRLTTGALAAIVAAVIGVAGFAATTGSGYAQGNKDIYARNSHLAPAFLAQADNAPPADFGAPPSGEVPILFNDHHVYAKPDRLKSNRVLAALVRGNTVLVPLRSMFEQMGATVAWNPATRTVTVSKQGADVKVTVGRPEVMINGEARPLDVPPEVYRGTIVVPLRVISEGMGAYVQWVSDKRLVVVRYVATAAPPPPPPPPPPMATPVPVIVPPPPPAKPIPTPSPTPVPVKVITYEHFVVGDYIFSPKVYNELSPGNSGSSSWHVGAGFEFPLIGLPWMAEGDYRSFKYPHNSFATAGACPIAGDAGCVTVNQGNAQVYVPGFTARDQDIDARLGLKIFDPRVYIAVGYLWRNTNYEGGGSPNQQHGVGFGLEKLPDLNQIFSIYGSAYYYPSITAKAQLMPDGTTQQVQYRYLKYAVGGTLNFGKSPIYLDFGYLGDRGSNKMNAPSGFSHAGPYAGLGIHF